ncbi:MAG: group III truncated hemoglobin [Candidatus Nitronauta litoralis]|uniref:Group III truncated hemoglobin n=1 Tax=Candidatus Nitronauta litoralis TaxID=2705533 RepID=A0A7T0BVH3_9BACT|nr:MAG: group III truncated hemoglobin [Candidatus Nitronauta litoralis]
MESRISISNSKREDLDSPENIKVLVDAFYTRVQQNEILAPVFDQTINDWSEHLPKMYLFWESLLFGTGEYSGNPFQKHVVLPIEAQHFQTWLQLFLKTVDQYFEGEKANQAKESAKTIAKIFQRKMGIAS